MMETNWVPGIVVLSAAVVAAVVALLVTRKRGPVATTDTKLADLEQRLSLLMEQLRALEAERAKMGDEAFAQEKARLELEAAAALRARDEYLKGMPAPQAAPSPAASVTTAPSPTQAPAPTGFFARHPELKGALWGAGVVVFFVALGFVLTREQRDRAEGENITGANPNEAVAQQQPQQPSRPEDDPVFKQAWERARANPQETDAAAFVAHEFIRLQRFDEADELTKKALAADPFHVESRIHEAVLRATDGRFREALDDLGHLAKTYPGAHEAYLFRGALALQVGESRLALESFERFAAEAPPQEHPAQLQSAIQMLRQRVRP